MLLSGRFTQVLLYLQLMNKGGLKMEPLRKKY